MQETLQARKDRAKKIVARLKKEYPESKCSLDYKTPLQLLVATILSAQCTDQRVNIVTKVLFKKYRDAAAYASAKAEALETDIRSTGFYKNKAKSIQNCCRALVTDHGDAVPGTMEELTKLAGVGRKTANVILGNCFGVPGVVVDTHVKRLSGRLGFTTLKDPDKIERDLNAAIPQKDWTLLSHMLIDHGRRICQARAPNCPGCAISRWCPSREAFSK